MNKMVALAVFGTFGGFVVGVIVGCLFYSGRNDCICSVCRLGLDTASPEGDRSARSDGRVIICNGFFHSCYAGQTSVGDICSCGEVEVKSDGGVLYFAKRRAGPC